jgi:hypothetical protein
MRTTLLVLLAALGLIACGGESNKSSDAPAGSDAPPTSDGNPGDGTPPNDNAPPGDAAVGTLCGTATCDVGQECCVGAGGSTCVDEGTCQTVAFQCDGPEDCETTEVCCFGAGGQGGGGTECKAGNQCQNNACHEDMDCGGQTPTCCAIKNTQYSMCLAQCPP